ncbi:MAG TPA: hypothetical protein VHJ82_07855 [Actinomycetota bacterium]|nr:hypothetical protein [Actinomycetota bacterium]
MSRAEEISRREGRGSFLLWFGLLGAPLAWVTQLVVNYSLEEWFACSPGAQERGEVAGLGVPTAAVIVSATLTVVAVLAGLVAWRCLRRMTTRSDASVGGRARWMAVAGIMNTILYTIALVASFAPPALLDVCRSSP